jgi:hypothetical protein
LCRHARRTQLEEITSRHIAMIAAEISRTGHFATLKASPRKVRCRRNRARQLNRWSLKEQVTSSTNTRGFFKPDIRTFLARWVAEGPTHHFALGVGKHARTIKNLGDVLGIESVIVSEM